jgi:hypothetical protein
MHGFDNTKDDILLLQNAANKHHKCLQAQQLQWHPLSMLHNCASCESQIVQRKSLALTETSTCTECLHAAAKSRVGWQHTHGRAAAGRSRVRKARLPRQHVLRHGRHHRTRLPRTDEAVLTAMRERSFMRHGSPLMSPGLKNSGCSASVSPRNNLLQYHDPILIVSAPEQKRTHRRSGLSIYSVRSTTAILQRGRRARRPPKLGLLLAKQSCA